MRWSLCLHPSHFCSISCVATCFPRIRGLCFHPSQVDICKDFRQDEDFNSSETKTCSHYKNKSLDVPSLMRFHGERLTLPVVHSSFCMGNHEQWITGLAMVADQRYLPYGKPNPHHEAEKLIPALLMHQKIKELANTTLYWFASQNELSKWAVGFMQAVGMEGIVQFLELPKKDEAAVCFEDAVIFSAPTNLWYIPDKSWNQWLQRKVLHHCSIPSENASRPVKTAAILDRKGGTRHFSNKQQVAETIHRVLNISVRQGFGGVGTFCEQVQTVVAEDLLIVPHGSQNTNLVFARPGTVVIEVFPYLYYTDALRNVTHATGLEVYAILGEKPRRDFLMWLFSLAGWDVCLTFKWCKNYARRQPITVDIQELEKILFHVSQEYIQPLASST
ncbi:hypothetical protein GOP47_0002523 [Adiantum capillus-veneris]|uniref:Glycosyltransferase 61 catalytic domain-containing protein n=1 Tax=Adiantum capillus-veneris TaxID=13818 RepID=A0A9D4ZRP9_ADICA|nr:hypothetical protein GOP47_0002523 [Adiantum capillus-veneris]